MGTKSSCPPPQELQAFLLGQSSSADGVAVSEHLASCPQCQAVLQGFAALGRVTACLGNPATLAVGPKAAPSLSLAAAPAASAVAEAPVPAGAFPFLRPPQAPDEIGRLGHYRVLRLLGRGGMALVFQAEDTTLRRQVALKVMKPQLTADLEPLQRFLREARVMAAIKHEYLVTLYQAGQEGDAVYLAMELLEGQSLEERLHTGAPLDTTEIVRVGREIAVGLSVIHRQGLVHRDIKPSNIWLEAPRGRVKILDFGLARSVERGSSLTPTGTIVGTPAFMSPEQARGDKLDTRSDLFSLGAVLYYLCTRTPPFQSGGDILSALRALALHEPRPVEQLNPAVPSALAALVRQLMAKNPAQRPASAEEVAARLEQIAGSVTSVSLPASRIPVAPALPETRVPPVPDLAAPAERRRWRSALAYGLVLLAAFAGGGLVSLLVGQVSQPAQEPASTPASAGERVYLSDLKPIRTVNWPFTHPPGKEPPPDAPRLDFFKVISIDNKPSPHGIGMHPFEETPSSISYSLDRQYDIFDAAVSLNDTAPRSHSPMTFTVSGDGWVLWESKPLVSRQETQTCRVAVKDVAVLTLEVKCGDDHRGAHGVWIEPYVAKHR